jgi:hypothetical protein
VTTGHSSVKSRVRYVSWFSGTVRGQLVWLGCTPERTDTLQFVQGTDCSASYVCEISKLNTGAAHPLHSLPCGHSFCRSCLIAAFQAQFSLSIPGFCPQCQIVLQRYPVDEMMFSHLLEFTSGRMDIAKGYDWQTFLQNPLADTAASRY